MTKRMPFPTPADAVGTNNDFLIHQEVAVPKPPLVSIGPAILAYEVFRDLIGVEMSEEAFNALSQALQDVVGKVAEIVGNVPAPIGVVKTDEQVYMPYLMIAGMAVLSSVVTQTLPDKTVPDRAAVMMEFVRAWAMYTTAARCEQLGLSAQQTNDLSAMRAIIEPAPLGVVIGAVHQKAELQKEADAQGITIADLATNKLRGMGINKKPRGEPEDEPKDQMAF